MMNVTGPNHAVSIEGTGGIAIQAPGPQKPITLKFGHNPETQPNDQSHDQLDLRHQNAPAPKAPRKANWPIVALFSTWLATLGGGGMLGYQQYETNLALASQNTTLATRLDETEDRFQNYTTQQEFNQLNQRTGQLLNRLDSMQETLRGAHSSLNQLQGSLGSLQNDSGRQIAELNRIIRSLRNNLDSLQHNVREIDNRVIDPAVVARTMPGTAQVLAMAGGRTLGGGSGIWIKDHATGNVYLLTNHHVVEKKEAELFPGLPAVPVRYAIRQHNTTTNIAATIVHENEDLDLALLKVDQLPSGVVPVTFRNLRTDPLIQGERAFAVGGPSGLQDNVTAGIISHTHRVPPFNRNTILVQTDAPINPGNSGGGLFDSQGRLIGINELVIRQMPATTDGLGMSIRVDIVQQYLQSQNIRAMQ